MFVNRNPAGCKDQLQMKHDGTEMNWNELKPVLEPEKSWCCTCRKMILNWATCVMPSNPGCIRLRDRWSESQTYGNMETSPTIPQLHWRDRIWDAIPQLGPVTNTWFRNSNFTVSLEAEGKGTKASEGKCGNVKRGVVVTGLFLWSIYSKTCSDILHKAVSYRY